MACPFFAPQRVAENPSYAHARLPLIEEYEGLCWAAGQPVTAPEELRFRCCNHGYTNGCCAHFPASEERAAMRYSVLEYRAGDLHVICVEEKSYAPLRWRSVHYFADGGSLSPEIADVCTRAQVVAFCTSYLKRILNGE